MVELDHERLLATFAEESGELLAEKDLERLETALFDLALERIK